MNTPIVAPYPGGIPIKTLRAVVESAVPAIPGAVLARLANATAEMRRLTQAQAALDSDSVHQAHSVSINEAVAEIQSGAAPETIAAVPDVASIAAEYSAKRDAIRAAKAGIATGSVDDIVEAGEIIRSAVSELATQIEKTERADAQVFNLPFVASQKLALVRAASVVIGRRFSGIREAIVGDPEHAGSPATYFADLLEVAEKW